MKQKLKYICLSIFFSFSFSQNFNIPSFGFTIGNNNVIDLLMAFDNGVLLTPTIYGIYQMDSNRRFEPSIAYFRLSDDNNNYSSAVSIGFGILEIRPTESGNYSNYLGLRSFITFINGSNDPMDILGYAISPVCGGEYYFSQNFSVGGEVQLTLQRFDEGDLSIIDVGALLFFRFYN